MSDAVQHKIQNPAREAGRKGGLASGQSRQSRKVAVADLKAALEAKDFTPGQRALARLILAAYSRALRAGIEATQRQPETSGQATFAAFVERGLERLGMLPPPADKSQTPALSPVERGAQPPARPKQPAKPDVPFERVFTWPEWNALPVADKNAWLRKPEGTWTIEAGGPEEQKP